MKQNTEEANWKSSRLANVLLAEPLVPFAVLGGLFFLLYGITQPAPIETIEISPQTLQAVFEFEGFAHQK